MGLAKGRPPTVRRPAFQRRPENESRPLSPKQQRFVEEYLVDLSKTHAVVRAGYTTVKAANTAHKLLCAPHIRQAIDQAMAERRERVQITHDMVLQELALIGFAELGSELVKPEVKRAALVDIGRHLGMFKEHVTVSIVSEMSDEDLIGIVRAGRDRASAQAADQAGPNGLVH